MRLLPLLSLSLLLPFAACPADDYGYDDVCGDLVDDDGDGAPVSDPFGCFGVIDCNDDDGDVHPDADDPRGDGIDQNCDGFDGEGPPTCNADVECAFLDPGNFSATFAFSCGECAELTCFTGAQAFYCLFPDDGSCDTAGGFEVVPVNGVDVCVVAGWRCVDGLCVD